MIVQPLNTMSTVILIWHVFKNYNWLLRIQHPTHIWKSNFIYFFKYFQIRNCWLFSSRIKILLIFCNFIKFSHIIKLHLFSSSIWESQLFVILFCWKDKWESWFKNWINKTLQIYSLLLLHFICLRTKYVVLIDNSD